MRLKSSCKRRQARLQLQQIELDAHEEHAALRIHRVLVGLYDIRTLFVQELRYRGYDSRLVGTGNQHPGADASYPQASWFLEAGNYDS